MEPGATWHHPSVGNAFKAKLTLYGGVYRRTLLFNIHFKVPKRQYRWRYGYKNKDTLELGQSQKIPFVVGRTRLLLRIFFVRFEDVVGSSPCSALVSVGSAGNAVLFAARCAAAALTSDTIWVGVKRPALSGGVHVSLASLF
ncbi:hypothetical protein HW555_007282 [Spodoptera exigua]|uniref:Uncharacterized protein n=1 Tax=Spodoptera exigua TaxID=7107 RepID=A0A835GGF4_SPOEX|nr:hypothetical protein HW555_007282 [Spodoptera exigua]